MNPGGEKRETESHNVPWERQHASCCKAGRGAARMTHPLHFLFVDPPRFSPLPLQPLRTGAFLSSHKDTTPRATMGKLNYINVRLPRLAVC